MSPYSKAILGILAVGFLIEAFRAHTIAEKEYDKLKALSADLDGRDSYGSFAFRYTFLPEKRRRLHRCFCLLFGTAAVLTFAVDALLRS